MSKKSTPRPSKPFDRDRPVQNYQTGEIGFIIENLKALLADQEIPHGLGWFLCFPNNGGNQNIENIKLKAVVISQNALNLQEISNAKVTPFRAVQYKNSGTTEVVDSVYLAQNKPSLRLERLADGTTRLENIRGYRNIIEVVYLDGVTLKAIYTGIKDHIDTDGGDTTLRLFFSGAEVNFGEMASPFFQYDRHKDWDFSDRRISHTEDSSICFTLKAENLYKVEDSNGGNVPGDLYTDKQQATSGVRLPGVYLLPSCPRYWQTVKSITTSFLINSTDITMASYNQLSSAITPQTLQKLIEEGEPISL